MGTVLLFTAALASLATVTGLAIRAQRARERELTLRATRLAERETALGAIADNGEVGIWSGQASSTILRLSPAARRMHGITDATPVSRQLLLDIIHPEDRTRVEASLAGVMPPDQSIAIEYRTTTTDGSARWISVRIRPTSNSTDEFGAVCFDITDQRRFADELCAANGELTQRGAELATELDNLRQANSISLPNTPVVPDRPRGEGCLQALHAAARALADAPALADALPAIMQAVATTFAWQSATLWSPTSKDGPLRRSHHWRAPGAPIEATAPESPELATHAWKANEAQWNGTPKEASEKMVASFAVPLQPTQNSRVVIEVCGCLPDDNGADIRMMLATLAAQISQFLARKDAEKRMDEATSTITTATRAKSDFLALMSHEIRTPMNGVIGMTNLLLGTELTPKQRDFARTIRTSGDSLLSVINDILDFSKMEAGKLPFEKIDFDLRSAVEDTLDLMAGNAHAKRLELSAFVHPDVPSMVHGDPNRLRQVLNNLVANAIKFTTQGEVAVTVATERTTSTQVVLRFAIRDTGIGIPTEAQQRLFQPFMQADTSTTRRFGGTGLGLAISRQLVELMHGRIGTVSEEGKGSTFHFTVSLEPATTVAPEATKQILAPPGTRILVIDDNVSVASTLTNLLKARGLAATRATTGEAALRHLRDGTATGSPYTLAILDTEMPDAAGTILARAISADPGLPTPKVILLAGIGQYLEDNDVLAAGAAACLTKPVRESRFYETVAAVLTGTALAPDRTRRHTETFEPPVPAVPAPVIPGAPRLLLVEDNIINQQVALQQLARLGFKADIAVNGVDALAALRRAPYDVVLMDCMMPEMDGYEATQRIREIERRRAALGIARPQVHIIALTANAGADDRARCLAAGMNEFTTKPLRAGDLRRLLARWRPAVAPVVVAADQPERVFSD